MKINFTSNDVKEFYKEHEKKIKIITIGTTVIVVSLLNPSCAFAYSGGVKLLNTKVISILFRTMEIAAIDTAKDAAIDIASNAFDAAVKLINK